jgi:hypothetical protein
VAFEGCILGFGARRHLGRLAFGSRGTRANVSTRQATGEYIRRWGFTASRTNITTLTDAESIVNLIHYSCNLHSLFVTFIAL